MAVSINKNIGQPPCLPGCCLNNSSTFSTKPCKPGDCARSKASSPVAVTIATLTWIAHGALPCHYPLMKGQMKQNLWVRPITRWRKQHKSSQILRHRTRCYLLYLKFLKPRSAFACAQVEGEEETEVEKVPPPAARATSPTAREWSGPWAESGRAALGIGMADPRSRSRKTSWIVRGQMGGFWMQLVWLLQPGARSSSPQDSHLQVVETASDPAISCNLQQPIAGQYRFEELGSYT